MGRSFSLFKRVVLLLFLLSGLHHPAFAKATYQSRYQPGSKEVRILLYDRVPPYNIQTDGAWSRIVLPGADQPAVQSPDLPQLPAMEYWISVPQGTLLKDVQVTAETENRKLELPLAPVQKPYIYKPGVAPPPLSGDPGVYQSENEYPAAGYDYGFRRMGSTQVLVLRVRLFKYLGAQKTLKIFHEPKIQVILEAPHWNAAPTPRNIVDREIKHKLVNPEEAFFNAPLR